MPTETLHFENARLAQQLFNNEPRNLQALADELAVKAVARENWIKLDGSADALERARQMFQLLESSVQNGGTVRNREFAQALNVVKNEGVSALRTLLRRAHHHLTAQSARRPQNRRAEEICRCHSRP